MIVYLNDRFVNKEEALLHVSDLSMQRGYGIFDFFRTVNGVPLFVHDHLQRFRHSAEGLHLPFRKSNEELLDIVKTLLKQSGLQEAGIRLMLTGGYAADGYQVAEPNLVITCNPVKVAGEAEFNKGVTAITWEHQRELPHIKTINYLMGVWMQPLLKEKNVNEVLYHKNNAITEFPRSNVFIVTGGTTLVTPADNILKGITRGHVLSLAKDILPVEERAVSPEELLQAKEVFLTSTTRKLIPVVKINEQVIGTGQPGEITRRLYRQFQKMEASVTPPPGW